MIAGIMGIVLASTSRHRRMIMDRLSVPYVCAAPEGDESLPEGTPPGEGTAVLAARKAESVARLYPGCLIVGSDQMAVLDGRVLEKPGSVDRAIEQILGMSGRMHELWTSVAVLAAGGPGGPKVHTEVHRMWMRRVGREEAAAYVAADAPLDCAGSYRFESRGSALFEKVEGGDPTAITGLPLAALGRMLREAGAEIPGEPET